MANRRFTKFIPVGMGVTPQGSSRIMRVFLRLGSAQFLLNMFFHSCLPIISIESCEKLSYPKLWWKTKPSVHLVFV